jgi:hypothetical protein
MDPTCIARAVRMTSQLAGRLSRRPWLSNLMRPSSDVPLQGLAQLDSVFRAEVDFILGAVEAEANREGVV